MEKYDVIEKVSPYLHAVGRIVRVEPGSTHGYDGPSSPGRKGSFAAFDVSAGTPRVRTPDGFTSANAQRGHQQHHHHHHHQHSHHGDGNPLQSKPGTAALGMPSDGSPLPPPPPPRPSRRPPSGDVAPTQIRPPRPPQAERATNARPMALPSPVPLSASTSSGGIAASSRLDRIDSLAAGMMLGSTDATPKLRGANSSAVFASPEASPPQTTTFSAQEALGSAALTSALGSCVMITRVDRSRAFILTTSFVIATRREAAEAEAVFFEARTLGTGIKNVPTHPVRVKLRPEKLFFTSAPDSVCRMTTTQRRLHADAVGYTVIACDVEGTENNPFTLGNTTVCIRPLTLPLLASSIPAINEGDSHLVVTHVDGMTRRSFGFAVESVFEGHSCYSTSDISTTFASGGAIFDRNGEFVGLHHEFGDANDCIHIGAIVKHLYHSLVLGRLGVPVVTVSKEVTHLPQEHDGSVTGIESLALAPNGEPRQILDRPHGNGSTVVDMQILDYETKKRRQRVKKTLVMPTHLEVFQELYNPDKYESLVLMLHAFHSHSKLLALILDRMLSHDHRTDLASLARHGGVGIVLEAIASSRAYDVALLSSGMTLVGRMSLFDDNREALSKYSGVQTVLSILQDYINSPSVVQWGIYALLNLVQPECSRARENITAIASFSGLRTILTAMSRFPDERHLVRWGALTTGHIVEDNKTNFDLAVEANACTVIFDAFKRHATSDEFVSYGLVFALAKLVQHDAFFAATDYFVRAGIVPLLASLFEGMRKCQEPSVLVRAVAASESILTAWPGAVEEAVSRDFEALLSAVALARMTEAPLHAGIFRVLKLLGVADPSEDHPHLQIPGGAW